MTTNDFYRTALQKPDSDFMPEARNGKQAWGSACWPHSPQSLPESAMLSQSVAFLCWVGNVKGYWIHVYLHECKKYAWPKTLIKQDFWMCKGFYYHGSNTCSISHTRFLNRRSWEMVGKRVPLTIANMGAVSCSGKKNILNRARAEKIHCRLELMCGIQLHVNHVNHSHQLIDKLSYFGWYLQLWNRKKLGTINRGKLEINTEDVQNPVSLYSSQQICPLSFCGQIS